MANIVGIVGFYKEVEYGRVKHEADRGYMRAQDLGEEKGRNRKPFPTPSGYIFPWEDRAFPICQLNEPTIS